MNVSWSYDVIGCDGWVGKGGLHRLLSPRGVRDPLNTSRVGVDLSAMIIPTTTTRPTMPPGLFSRIRCVFPSPFAAALPGMLP